MEIFDINIGCHIDCKLFNIMPFFILVLALYGDFQRFWLLGIKTNFLNEFRLQMLEVLQKLDACILICKSAAINPLVDLLLIFVYFTLKPYVG